METTSRHGLARGRPALPSRLRLRFRISVVVTTLVAQLVVYFGTAVSARMNRAIAFNIEPKQPESLLIACSRRTHIQVVIAQDAGSDTETSALYGIGRDHAALDLLFSRCGLRYAVIGNSVIVMRSGPPLKG
jgi:hypothetical protein